MRVMLPSLKTIVLSVSVVFMAARLWGAEIPEYERTRMCFANFIRCELTRTNAIDRFMGKPFEITMINLFDAVHEGDLLIAAGAVDCFVEKKYERLYVAVGVKSLMGREKVSYFVVRTKDFAILATELMKYPYKERCGWTQYWIDID